MAQVVLMVWPNNGVQHLNYRHDPDREETRLELHSFGISNIAYYQSVLPSYNGRWKCPMFRRCVQTESIIGIRPKVVAEGRVDVCLCR